ncbi:Hypothetical predicted protein [Mytilus galloprovincialis]|uniref:Uncharacterized protein n=1 Tax=Mytilus galloprovincialis TaxID=29158 RepID=A0A8B6D1V3_MYTGA|nr:Hypothetical predicted protein [Mytilus galloprovincialis]
MTMLIVRFIVLLSVFVGISYGWGDQNKYDTSAQAKCTEVTRGPTRDCRWPAGLNMQVDQIAAGGKIAAYKIRWFGGSWSGWVVPGYNDMDWKINLVNIRCSMPYKANSLRRVWSYFYDHTHKFIVCKA